MDFTWNNVSPYDLIVGQPQAHIAAILLPLTIIQRMGNILWDRPSKAFQCLHFTCQIFLVPVNIYSEAHVSVYRSICKMGLKELHILIGILKD